MSRLRVILVVFSVTAFLIFTILLRTSASRMFFQYQQSSVKQKELLQQLWQKQLQFEWDCHRYNCRPIHRKTVANECQSS
jgi:hypothetical protein